MKGTGYIYNSKLSSSRSNTMSMKFTDPYQKKYNTPGPGSYQIFSEFGIYKSKNADEMDRKLLYGGRSQATANKTKSSELGNSKIEESKNEGMEDNNKSSNAQNESQKKEDQNEVKDQKEVKEETKNPEAGNEFGDEL